MTIMSQIAIVFGTCLLAEGISALLPFKFPASVIAMILLLVLLLTGAVKKKQVDKVCSFFVTNMSFFFVAPCVGIMEHYPKLVDCLVPFFLIAAITTPVVYFVAGWTTQLLIRWVDKKEGAHD